MPHKQKMVYFLSVTISYSCGRSLQLFSAKCWNIVQRGAATIDQHEIKSPFIGEQS